MCVLNGVKWGDMWLKKSNSKEDTDEIISSQHEFAALTIHVKYISHFFQQPLRHTPSVPVPFCFCSTF